MDTANEQSVHELYRTLIEAWNNRDAAAMARCFAPDGTQIGFDGSEAVGPEDIRAHLGPIFADHPTAAFVTKVVDVQHLAPDVVLLRAVAGMVPRGRRRSCPRPTPTRRWWRSGATWSGVSSSSRPPPRSSTAVPSWSRR